MNKTRSERVKEFVTRKLPYFGNFEDGGKDPLADYLFFYGKDTPFGYELRRVKTNKERTNNIEWWVEFPVFDIFFEGEFVVSGISIYSPHKAHIDTRFIPIGDMPKQNIDENQCGELHKIPILNMTLDEYYSTKNSGVSYHELVMDDIREAMRSKINNQEYMRYKEYLQSRAWKTLRRECFTRDGFQCVVCGSAININAHHTNYDHVGQHEIDDLVTLCECCHKKAHETDNERKRTHEQR